MNGLGVEETIGIGGMYCLNEISCSLLKGALVVDEKPFRSLIWGGNVVVTRFDCAVAIGNRFCVGE